MLFYFSKVLSSELAAVNALPQERLTWEGVELSLEIGTALRPDIAVCLQ